MTTYEDMSRDELAAEVAASQHAVRRVVLATGEVVRFAHQALAAEAAAHDATRKENQRLQARLDWYVARELYVRALIGWVEDGIEHAPPWRELVDWEANNP
jgi:hypothetical protein